MGGYVSLAFAEKYPEYLKSLTLFFPRIFRMMLKKRTAHQKLPHHQRCFRALRKSGSSESVQSQ
jgi:pimeloyl-ACP methyl ester carboxylesterase